MRDGVKQEPVLKLRAYLRDLPLGTEPITDAGFCLQVAKSAAFWFRVVHQRY